MTDKDRMEQSGEIDEFWELDDASDTAAQKGSGKRQEGQDTVGRKASPHSTCLLYTSPHKTCYNHTIIPSSPKN